FPGLPAAQAHRAQVLGAVSGAVYVRHWRVRTESEQAAESQVPMPAPPGNPSFYVDPSKLGNFGNSFSELPFLPFNSIAYRSFLKVIIG
ncbi:hypothetical protein L4664_006468, partial [Pseudomonas aeruginosa]